MSKGDNYRPVNKERFDKNYDLIFKKKGGAGCHAANRGRFAKEQVEKQGRESIGIGN